MQGTDKLLSGRREFLGRVVPVCAATCLGLETLLAAGDGGRDRDGAGVQAAGVRPAAQAKTQHKFERELPRKFTAAQLFGIEFGSMFIPYANYCLKELGKGRTLEMLRAFAGEMGEMSAREFVNRMGKRDFAALRSIFDPASPSFSNTLTFSVAESTERAFELRVTECLWARTFKHADAEEIGYASICFGDYAFVRAFNPAIEMVRDKTLMQGREYCNHRYLWKG